MKPDMSKGSPFRIHVYPKIWYWSAVAVSAILIIVKVASAFFPVLLLCTVASLGFGMMIGITYSRYFVRKITEKRQFLSSRTTSAVVWGLVLVCLLFTPASLGWPFLLSVVMIGYSAGYFYFYLPRMI